MEDDQNVRSIEVDSIARHQRQETFEVFEDACVSHFVESAQYLQLRPCSYAATRLSPGKDVEVVLAYLLQCRDCGPVAPSR